MTVPTHLSLSIPALERREKPAFEYRYMSWWHQIKPEKYYFYIRNRYNRGINPGELRTEASRPVAVNNITPDIGPGVHTLEFYMNPTERYHPAFAPFPKPRYNGLFEKFPTYFSMNQAKKRVKNQQVCFSNKNMRKLLTEQITDVIRASGSKGIMSLDANDVPGHFCYCEECKQLEKKYGCVSGPLFDYLIELCRYLETHFPDVMVKTLAYRKAQSEAPPKNITKLPDNLIVVFAPIDDNFAATLKHPANQETYENLKQWCRMSRHVWVWYYTNPYAQERPPFGGTEKLCQDIKNIYDAGVTGTQFEHGGGASEGLNFSELQTWLMAKLFQNPNQDYAILINEFTDFYYGDAAPLMRIYMKELEQHRKEMKLHLSWNARISEFKYLNPKNLVKWQKIFDQMELLTEGNEENLFHVQKVRVSLDLVTIGKYQAVKKAFPDFKPNLTGLEKRFRTVYSEMLTLKAPLTEQRHLTRIDKILKRKLILANLKESIPLPSIFDAFAKDDIRQAIPVHKIKKNSQAAFGIVQGGKNNELPFTCGLHDKINKKWISPASIQKKNIKPDRFAFYKLSRSILTPQCLFWGSQKWSISISLDQFYEAGHPNQEWDIYASLKFEGPLYGSKDNSIPNRVFCDRIVLVKVPD